MTTIEQFVIDEFLSGKSPYEIAERLQWNHMKVRRLIKKAGIPLRGKGSAQQAALKSGRAKNPMKKPGSAGYNETEPLTGDENVEDSGS